MYILSSVHDHSLHILYQYTIVLVVIMELFVLLSDIQIYYSYYLLAKMLDYIFVIKWGQL